MTKVSQNLKCPFCDRTGFRSMNGVKGHVQFVHPELWQSWLAEGAGTGVNAEESESVVPGPVLASATSSIRELKARCEREEYLDKLEAIEIKRANRARAPTFTEGLGAGVLSGDAAQKTQMELLNEVLGKRSESSVTDYMMKKLIDNFVDGTSKDGSKTSDGLPGWLAGTVSLLGLLGVGKDEIKSIVKRVVTPETLNTTGMTVEGLVIPANISEASFQKILEYKQGIEVAAAEKAGRERMADSWDALSSTLMPMILAKFSEGGGGPSIASAPKPQLLPCPNPECGANFDVSGAAEGETLNCPKCGSEFTCEATPPKERPAPPSKIPRAKKPAPAEEILCVSCQGVIIVDGHSTGSKISCPHCSATQEIHLSSDIPLPAVPVKQPDTLYELNRSRRG